MTTLPTPSPSLISPTTLFSLLSCILLLLLAILLSHRLLPRPTRFIHLCLHTWHLFDFLIHAIFEGSYLYHSLFSYTCLPPPASDYPHPASLGPSSSPKKSFFLGYSDRRYGAAHSTAPTALLWQEYARADTRWATTDTTIISIELLTVLLAGPAALYICYLLQRQSASQHDTIQSTRKKIYTNDAAAPTLWFLITMLATAELYGGFMTFAPEWLTGNPNLHTENPLHLWVYLVFFNGLWVVMPAWCLWVAWGEIARAFARNGNVNGEKKGQ
ncbi:MAG: hypothetical protein Q9182_006009 [Xanthomendoza sp. 2 TL-2023]